MRRTLQNKTELTHKQYCSSLRPLSCHISFLYEYSQWQRWTGWSGISYRKYQRKFRAVVFSSRNRARVKPC